MKQQSFVLDSYALLAYFQAEAGGSSVRDILKQARENRAQAFLSLLNLGEIFYTVARRRGKETARGVVENISFLPVQCVEAGRERVLEAAEIKADYSLSYADAFAAACALEFSAVLVTGDAEFQTVEPRIPVLWIE